MKQFCKYHLKRCISLQCFRYCFGLPLFGMQVVINNLMVSEKCLTCFENLLDRVINEVRSCQKKFEEFTSKTTRTVGQGLLSFFIFFRRINLHVLLGNYKTI